MVCQFKSLNQYWQAVTDRTLVKVSDRESDLFALYAQPRVAGVEVLIRVRHTHRKVYMDGQLMALQQSLAPSTYRGAGQVPIYRQHKLVRAVPVRYYSCQVVLPSPKAGDKTQLKLNVVWVKEDSSAGAGLEWGLLTTLGVDTLADVVRIAGYYRQRWVIERFHYILKSGLHIEQLQIDSGQRLQNALQLYSLIGWHLLHLQKLGQVHAQEPASQFVEPSSIALLEAIHHGSIHSLHEFVLALAALVGFRASKQQAYPGEKTLWQAISRFNQIQLGFQVANSTFYGTG